jgi:BirA family biotin operon repressor/biotin-[acetyl-CoA-carboxylase] ligase
MTMPALAEDRRALVLSALRAAPSGVSGETIAARLGVSRVAVAKHVAVLRALGYRIDAAAGRGYRLLSPPDAPLPLEVVPLLSSAMWGPLSGGGSTGSTNDDCRALRRPDCRALAAVGAPEGAVVLASAQTAGKGRLGRTWASPEGGVYLSALLRPPLAVADAGPLALVVGIGVARGLASLGADVGLKWPNDVLALGPGEPGGTTGPGGPASVAGARPARPAGKIAGVLLESMSEGERLSWVVAGVGIDVRRPPTPAAGAAYLDDVAGPRPLARVAAAVLDGVAASYERFLDAGFAALAEEYASLSVLDGRVVRVSDRDGRPVADGVARGVDATGRLMVETAGGTVAVASGDVTLRA